MAQDQEIHTTADHGFLGHQGFKVKRLELDAANIIHCSMAPCAMLGYDTPAQTLSLSAKMADFRNPEALYSSIINSLRLCYGTFH